MKYINKQFLVSWSDLLNNIRQNSIISDHSKSQFKSAGHRDKRHRSRATTRDWCRWAKTILRQDEDCPACVSSRLLPSIRSDHVTGHDKHLASLRMQWMKQSTEATTDSSHYQEYKEWQDDCLLDLSIVESSYQQFLSSLSSVSTPANNYSYRSRRCLIII